MDEVFWSNVVKRWSEASENVIKLKKELAKLRDERSQHTTRNLERQTSSRPSQRDSQHVVMSTFDEDHDPSVDELKDVEAGLGRAREEYRRLQQELAASTEQIIALRLENEWLSANQQDISKLRNEHEQTLNLQKELDTARSDNKHYLEKIRSLEEELAHESPDRTPVPTAFKPPFLVSLEQQIEALRQSLVASEQDNHSLREDLKATQEKLRKAQGKKEVLRSSIVKLQDIARHSSLGALHPISNVFRATPDRTSRNISITSSYHSRNGDVSDTLSVKPSLQSGNENTRSHLSHNDDITLVVGEKVAPVTIPRGMLPPGRQNSISGLPSVSYNSHDDCMNNVFEREFLKRTLGGNLESLMERHSGMHPTSGKKPIMSSYLCPTLNHHPWCPSTPGQHGFIFVGLGKEKDTYQSPAYRHLFVGLPKINARDNREFRYLGRYKVSRVDPLTISEWDMLTADVKAMYAKLTKDKTKDPRSLEEIMIHYKNGDFHVPCVLLQCVSYDDQLVATLIAQRNAESLS